MTFVAPVDGSNDTSIDIGLRAPAANASGINVVRDASLPMCLGTQVPCQSAALYDGTTCALNDVCARQYRLASIDQLKTEIQDLLKKYETTADELAHHFGIDDDRLHELGWG